MGIAPFTRDIPIPTTRGTCQSVELAGVCRSFERRATPNAPASAGDRHLVVRDVTLSPAGAAGRLATAEPGPPRDGTQVARWPLNDARAVRPL